MNFTAENREPMKALRLNSISTKAVLAATALLCLSAAESWARLPVPYKHEGAITSIDREARVIVLAEPPKPKFRIGKIVKPTTFVWTENTQFIKNGQLTNATALSTSVPARLRYWYPPKKGRPFLVKIVWENDPKAR